MIVVVVDQMMTIHLFLVLVVVVLVICDEARLESYTSFVIWETEIITIHYSVKRDWTRTRRKES